MRGGLGAERSGETASERIRFQRTHRGVPAILQVMNPFAMLKDSFSGGQPDAIEAATGSEVDPEELPGLD